MFHDMLDDPQSAATLFELVDPSLPQPTAVMREFTPVPGIPRWTLRTKAGAFRLKMAGDVGTAAQLSRGAGVLEALLPRAAHGGAPAVPRLRRLELHLNETDLSAVIEERLGTGDARAAWPALSTTARCALAHASAEKLLALHAVPLAEVPALRGPGGGWGSGGGVDARAPSFAGSSTLGTGPGSVPGPVPGPERNGHDPGGRGARPWRDVVLGRIERRVAALRGDGVLENDLLARVETRLRTAAASLPLDLERRPCHGAFGLESVAVEKAHGTWTVLGIQDFELACAGDPWMDVAYWLASSGEPDGLAARSFFETYRERAAAPPDLPARIDLYAGLTVLRAIAYLASSFTEEGCSTIAEVTESWVSTAPRVWI